MEARATAKYVRVSSRKAKLVADLIRGKSLGEALSILALTPNKAAKITEKVVKSALANAENNHNMDPEKLYIDQIYADQGTNRDILQRQAVANGNVGFRTRDDGVANL